MFRICKAFTFDAAHRINGLPEGHKCARTHGHTYRVEVVLTADSLDDAGMVLDFGELAPLRKYLDDTYDHRHLNDVVDTPTSESLAAGIYHWVASNVHAPDRVYLESVRVSETPNTWAEYRQAPSDPEDSVSPCRCDD